jgi:hypothetical protein
MVNELTPVDDDQQSLEEPDPTQNAPDPIAELTAKVEQLESLNNVAADLRRTVGRIQSLETKLAEVQQASARDDIIEQVNQQFGSVNQMLATVVEGIDETALDPATKQRVREAAAASQRAAERAALKKEITAELQPQTPNAPVTEQTPGGIPKAELARYENAAVTALAKAGLDPDKDFDWAQASNILASGGGLSGLMDSVNETITQASSASRRQAAKENAGEGTPDAASAASDEAAQLERFADNADLDQGLALLRKMGVSY